jgi:hypothetical protein
MRPVLALLACSVFSLAACGSTPSEPPTTTATTEQFCSAAPIQNGDGTATMKGCSYEQHTYNITRNGTALGAGVVRDAQGAQVATATNACGRYLFGRDASGVSIIIDRETGDVQSHGQAHPGSETSTLTTIALPLAVADH